MHQLAVKRTFHAAIANTSEGHAHSLMLVGKWWECRHCLGYTVANIANPRCSQRYWLNKSCTRVFKRPRLTPTSSFDLPARSISFTIGDQFRLEGAFGVQFQRPFAKNSTQKFPTDQPFYAVLPNLPAPFDQGEIQLVISPDKHPIVIRGTFQELTFDEVGEALKAKYGTPMKASNRHIIHKVSGNHAIVKKLSEETIELAFIDTLAQTQQRQRLWEKESEGL